MLDIQDLQELEKVSSIKGMGKEDLEHLNNFVSKKNYQKGKAIFRQQQPIDFFCLVKQGEVKLGKISPPGEPEVYNIMKTGDFLGNLSMLKDAHCSNTAEALNDCELFIFDVAGFEKIIERKPSCALKIMRGMTVFLCYLLKKMDEKYIDMVDIMIDGELYHTRHDIQTPDGTHGQKRIKDKRKIKEKDLLGLPLFEILSSTERKQIAKLMYGCNFTVGEYIFVESAGEQKLYIIQNGSVKLTKNVQQGKTLTLSVLGDGKIFSVLSLLAKNEHSTTAQAIKDSYILVIDQSAFEELITQNPACSLKIINHFHQEMCNILKKIEQDFTYISKYLYETGPFYM